MRGERAAAWEGWKVRLSVIDTGFGGVSDQPSTRDGVGLTNTRAARITTLDFSSDCHRQLRRWNDRRSSVPDVSDPPMSHDRHDMSWTCSPFAGRSQPIIRRFLPLIGLISPAGRMIILPFNMRLLATPQSTRHEQARVIVADDERPARAFLAACWRIRGRVVIGEATNGAEAVELIERTMPDLVLLDLQCLRSTVSAWCG